jgi:hypothetical protein
MAINLASKIKSWGIHYSPAFGFRAPLGRFAAAWFCCNVTAKISIFQNQIIPGMP